MALDFPSYGHNAHLDDLRALFGDLRAGLDELPAFGTVVLLCFTNRCGSNYLAAGLASTGHVNMAAEALNREEVARRRAGHASFAGFLGAALGAVQLGGRVALKVGCPHLQVLWEAGVLDCWSGRVRYVFMERLDRLGQAVSWEIARQTGQWDSRYPASTAEPAYERARVLEAMRDFADANRRFDLFFGGNGIVPAHVLYEDLVAEPGRVVKDVGRAIGLPFPVFQPARVGLRRQAGARDAAWRARFLDGD